MEHRCENEVIMPALFTMPIGEIFKLSAAEFVATFPFTPITANKDPIITPTVEMTSPVLAIKQRTRDVDGPMDLEAVPALFLPEAFPTPVRDPSCASSTPLIEIVSPEQLVFRQTVISTPPRSRSPEQASRRLGAPSASRARADTLKVTTVYNEYGELVNVGVAHRQPAPSELNVTQLLRLIKKAYRHEASTSPYPTVWVENILRVSFTQ
jgi:hypothetical protein